MQISFGINIGYFFIVLLNIQFSLRWAIVGGIVYLAYDHKKPFLEQLQFWNCSETDETVEYCTQLILDKLNSLTDWANEVYLDILYPRVAESRISEWGSWIFGTTRVFVWRVFVVSRDVLTLWWGRL